MTKSWDGVTPPASGKDNEKTELKRLETSESEGKDYVGYFLEQSKKLMERSCSRIEFQEPMITVGDTGLIYPFTINTIQSKKGQHKSRLAQHLATMMLNPSFTFGGFKNCFGKDVVVLIIDTEHNIQDELPHMIQRLKKRAGFHWKAKPENLIVNTPKQLEVDEVQPAIEQWIQGLRKMHSDKHLFVLLDIATDCVADFNDPVECGKFVRYLGQMCDKHDSTFLCVIHEGKVSNHTLGHLGAALERKASCALRTNVEEGSDDLAPVISITVKELRNARKPPKMYVTYDQDNDILTTAPHELVDQVIDKKRKTKDGPGRPSIHIDVEGVIELLEHGLKESNKVYQKDFVETIQQEYGITGSKAKDVIKEIKENRIELFGIKCEKDGRSNYFTRKE